jgi:mono/diheme cytochrome c family protein
MRRLPPGTVPSEADEDPDVPASAREAAATSIPLPVTSDLMARGQNRYDIFCRPCHDLDGAADAPVGRNMQLRQPPSLLDPAIRQLPVGRIYQAISDGYGLMPSYAHQLTPADRWAVVAYVRALQLRSGISFTNLPPSVRDEAARTLGGPR